MTEEQKNREIEQMAKLLRKYLIEENGGVTIDELARRLVDEGVIPPMEKLLGNKKCKDFNCNCGRCPLFCLGDCRLGDHDRNDTLFEIIEDKKEELDYLYEPIMAKLNEEVQ